MGIELRAGGELERESHSVSNSSQRLSHWTLRLQEVASKLQEGVGRAVKDISQTGTGRLTGQWPDHTGFTDSETLSTV